MAGVEDYALVDGVPVPTKLLRSLGKGNVRILNEHLAQKGIPLESVDFEGVRVYTTFEKVERKALVPVLDDRGEIKDYVPGRKSVIKKEGLIVGIEVSYIDQKGRERIYVAPGTVVGKMSGAADPERTVLWSHEAAGYPMERLRSEVAKDELRRHSIEFILAREAKAEEKMYELLREGHVSL